MSEGTGVPSDWTRQPAQPVQGQQPGAPGQPPQGQQPVPPAPGGFGPPPVPYSQPAQQLPPQGQPVPPPIPQQHQPQQPFAPQPGPQQAPPPQWQPAPQPFQAEPNWTQLADQHENESRKRRRLWIGAAVLAVVLVGGVVAAGVVISGKGGGGNKPNPKPAASTGLPLEQALPLISDASTDKAPVDAATLFPDQTRTIDGKVWTRMVTGSTSPCSKATTGGLGLALGDDACRSLVRATYVSGESAVTVGIAVFDNKAGADKALGRHAGLVQGLSGPGVATFCVTDKSGCAETHAAVGRFGYFTVAGSLKQTPDQADPAAAAAASPLADRAKEVLLGRAKPAATAG
ncbi:hypothetical protein GCM10010495_20450 [Kitasatospora herbaricolor]|uniref:hypothetical protein n=1 Tax=Kitasatospora herbaricolor TaxID=68217 RepID=UPI0017498C23|nr:hypothetical protein [Kitasatospora herbaricolor]MDQ0310529.1 hypothetical protein [Kitasatospora herbaricolor]GGV07934.1 hypothetical protein GCM10010495_20450 [Kitasatospora herbaricolor]